LLRLITIVVNFVGLVAAVWLGIYIVARSPRKLLAWLTGLTLWSMAGLFLNMLLALNPPPLPADLPPWVPYLFPFWSAETLESGWSGWLQGWLVVPAIVFWHHLTVILRPEPMNRWRWTRVFLGYAVAISAILIFIYTPLVFSSVSGDPLYLNTLKPGPLYPLLITLFILYTGFSLINLLRSARAAPAEMQQKQLAILAAATLIAGLTGPVALVAAAFQLPIPRTSISLLLVIAVILLGYGVIRYSALVEGRTIRRDFVYNAIAIGLITALYLLVTWVSVRIFHVPAAAFIFLVLLAIITHSLIDIARQTLDYLFYREDKRLIRLNLRRLTSLVGEQDLEESLVLILDTMCSSVRATYGVIYLFTKEVARPVANYRWYGSQITLSPSKLAADDVQHLKPNQYPPPLDKAALLIPLYVNTEQIGTIIFGRPVNSLHFSQADVDMLLYPSDRVADAIRNAQRDSEHLSELTRITRQEQLEPGFDLEMISVKTVEDALRNLYDYAYLGDTPFAELKLVRELLPGAGVTHLDRGKAVFQVISDALEKLRPEGDRPKEPIPRDWYPYLILHDAYIEDKPNREIMASLYISEGTFNRTRRSAIRSVRRVLNEMDAALN
jgi:uncharacterized membrane protein YidH (DUF202 family)